MSNALVIYYTTVNIALVALNLFTFYSLKKLIANYSVHIKIDVDEEHIDD